MEIYSVKDKPLPIGRRILVYGFNIDDPRWSVDEFTKQGKSDHYQLNGNLYPHNISHWAELPEKPESGITPPTK